MDPKIFVLYVFIISLVLYLLNRFLPLKIALKYNVFYRIYKPKRDDFDWIATIENHKKYFFVNFLISVLVIFGWIVFGDGLLDRGFWIILAGNLLTSSLLEPVLK